MNIYMMNMEQIRINMEHILAAKNLQENHIKESHIKENRIKENHIKENKTLPFYFAYINS